MPRLEDGLLTTSANKFKKRRAWLTPEDEASELKPAAQLPITKSIERIAKPLAKAKQIDEHNKHVTRIEHDYNKSITRLNQDHNKSATRVEHDYNKSITSNSQTTPTNSHNEFRETPKLEHEYNKSITRLEHEYNNNVAQFGQNGIKTTKPFELEELFEFIEWGKSSIINYEEDARSLILSLSDVQKRVFWLVALECLNRNTNRTRPMEIKNFFEKLSISTPVVRTTLNRLVEKRILQREKGKLGKNGFAFISLPKTIFDAAHEIFLSFEKWRASGTKA